MVSNVWERVRRSFDPDAHEDVVKYLEWLNATIGDLSQTLRKTVALMLSLIAAFAIVNASPNATLSFGSISVSNSSLVIIFLPALISFLFFQVIRDTLQLVARGRAFTAAFSIWSEQAEENDLDALVIPSRAAYWDLGGTGRPSNTTWSERIGKIGQLGAAPVIFVGVIWFEVDAHLRLHDDSKVSHTLWAFSAIISGFFCIVAILQLAVKAHEDKLKPFGIRRK
jgi:hypothetical protein